MSAAFDSALVGQIDLVPTLGAACVGIVANFVLAGVASSHHVAYWSVVTHPTVTDGAGPCSADAAAIDGRTSF